MGKKGTRTKGKILDATIKCLATIGYENTTFQAIATECRVSQPLVVHYFKNKENIFPTVIEHLMGTTLGETVTALSAEKSATQKLKAYIRVSLKIFRSRPEFSKIYLTFYYLSGIHSKYRVINDRLKSEATNRIVEIIGAGLKSGEFKVDELTSTAKLIHICVTGLLLNLATETPLYSEDVLTDGLEMICLRMLGC